ncbi:MAG: VCBS repeat-containing protein [Planctomycetes bacterium]|nr:VCBS repeat-containing protein [Planctomycetota bacterium]
MKRRPRQSALSRSTKLVPQAHRFLGAAVIAAVAASASAQHQFAELSRRGLLPANSDDTRSTVLGDVDGDGDLDLVVGNRDQQNRLYLNSGTDTFTDATATRMPVGRYYTSSLALGDVDGDSDLDLVVGNDGEQSRLYLNNGTGTFLDTGASRMPVRNYATSAVTLGDVDRDGDLDLVLGNRGQRNRLYLNNGTGLFTDATTSRMPIGLYDTTSLALGDVDGDSDLDLVVGNTGSSGGQSFLYLNNGTGTFTDATASLMPVGLYGTTSLVLGDVDRDGDLDLVVGNSGASGGQSRLYLNSGAGTFTDATASRMPVGSYVTTSLALGDIDSDGDLDLVVGNGGFNGQQSRLYRNNGNGTFADETAFRMPVGNYVTTSLALGDVDGDGDLDLVVGNDSYPGGEKSRIYLNNSTGTFTDRTYGTASRLPVGNYDNTSLAHGDVDGDGDLDLVLGKFRGQSSLYLNNGTGSFTDVTPSRMPVGNYSTRSLVLGDVDGDGDLDLVLGNYHGENNLLYVNNGSGTFTDATASRMPPGFYYTTSLALGDVDGDSDLDLVLGEGYNAYRRGPLLYLNNGTGTFADESASRLPVGIYLTTSLALGDMDGDGDLDLVVLANAIINQQIRLYLNDGTGTFTDATASRMPVGIYVTQSLDLGDVDGDGDLDLVLGSEGQSRLFLNNGSGTFAEATASRMPANNLGHFIIPSLALGDVDRDGDLDLVLGESINPYIRGPLLYLNNGTGTFTDATASRLPVGSDDTFSVALGDVDGDGDLDLIAFARFQGGTIESRLYVNLHRQLDAPYILHAGRNYQLDVYSRYGPTTTAEIAFPFASTATANFPLPPFGSLGIDPTQMIALPPFVVAQPAGIGSLSFPVPNLPIFGGISIYTQVLLSQQPVQDRLTNVISDVLLQ